MSFLAGLRQRQSSADQGLRLCYLLTIHGAKRCVRLSLALAEFERGRPVAPGKAYVPCAEHLFSPPPYLEAGDLQILQQLLDEDRCWRGTASGPLPDSSGDRFLDKLLASGHCYRERGRGRWQPITRPAPDFPLADGQVEPVWRFDQRGAQRLHWQRPPGSDLFFHGRPYLFWTATGVVTVARCDLTTAAIAEALGEAGPLGYEEVAGVIAGRGAHWRALGLPLPIDPVVVDEPAHLTPVIQLTSSPASRGLPAPADRLELEFRYCGSDYCAIVPASGDPASVQYWDGANLRRLRRDLPAERDWAVRLERHLQGFTRCDEADCRWTASTERWRAFMLEARDVLQNDGFHFLITRRFHHHYVQADGWQVDLTGDEDGRWRFAVSIQAGDTRVDLFKVLNELVDQSLLSSDVELPDGRRLFLPRERLSGLREELGDLIGSSFGSRSDAYLAESQLSRLADLKPLLPKDTDWRGDLELLSHAEALHRQPRPLADGRLFLGVELRDYQQTGVCWLQHLRQHGGNGLLADDMGLGKTLQTIAHLAVEQRRGLLTRPALIVAPTSLLHNWESELRRFAPELRCRVQHGERRHQHWERLDRWDLVITSYALLARDVDRWLRQPLSWLVLDEAQAIKNPKTRISRVVRRLDSAHRLCLSGTPVANHLGEIWSIFDFLMPGLLGGAEAFNRYYRRPIEQDGDEPRFAQLLRRISPFMLRRTKDQVARDLPPKTEIVRRVAMAEDQRRLYQQLRRSQQRKLVHGFAEAAGEGQRQIQVLAALMKLRQTCCDPSLLGEPSISSAKRETCLEMIEELVAEGRAVLLFSQFTAMLELLAEGLAARSIDPLMLTGDCRDRAGLVEAFQRGDAPVFLVSLKAGGVGLNLTRADTVIHYDPWWNSAAEQQATDRAHRIGQDKPVFVYRLICEDSIEEKIAELQQHKAELGWRISERAERSGERFALGLHDLLALIDNEEEKRDAATVDA